MNQTEETAKKINKCIFKITREGSVPSGFMDDSVQLAVLESYVETIIKLDQGQQRERYVDFNKQFHERSHVTSSLSCIFLHHTFLNFSLFC